MRGAIVLFLALFIVLVGVVLTFFLRTRQAVAYGPAVTLCPGPDQYGYTCAAGAGYAYIPATIDSGLYSDDGLVHLPLPFPFTFYGAAYTSVHAAANGNLQFTTQNGAYQNRCLDEGPDAGMGDMIAPYWDDLDLTFRGYLRYDTAGSEPNRIFIVEWQNAPRYGTPTDTVTFAVQLFEGSNDIVFLYQNVNTFEGHSGSGATIGLQSAAQGLALQYGCNWPAVANAAALRFAHPVLPNSRLGLPGGAPYPLEMRAPEPGPAAKGEAAFLLEALNREGVAAVPRLQRYWLAQAQPRHSRWLWADVTGDGREELVVFLRPARPYPELSELLILGEAGARQWQILYALAPAQRQEPLEQVDLYRVADVTGDGRADVLLRDAAAGRLLVATSALGAIDLHPVPGTCYGSLTLRDVTGDGRLEIVRDGCEQPGRVTHAWNGQEFASVTPSKQ
jgi:hypothetical protein